MKKLLAIVLSLCLLLVFAGCGDAATTSSGAKEEAKVLSIDEVEGMLEDAQSSGWLLRDKVNTVPFFAEHSSA